MRMSYYPIRVLISLLDGSWKTAQAIAEEWHPGGAVDAGPYRKACQEMVGKLLRKLRIRRTKFGEKNKRGDKEFAINLISTSKFLAGFWDCNRSFVSRLLKNESFREYVRNLEKKSISKKGLVMTLRFLLDQYTSWVLISKSSGEEDKKLVSEFQEDWIKRNPDVLKDLRI